MPGMRLRSSRPRPTSIELCAGCGGMSLGLEAAGFSPLLQVERDAQCVRTLALNGYTEEKSVLHADLATVDFAPYRGRVDLVAGGVPCQPFSTSGLSNGANDERNLFEHAVRCVRECAPRAFLFENVAGLLRARFAEYLRGVLARLRALGYAVECHLTDASLFGCPQRRRRCLIVGRRDGVAYVPPTPTTPTPPTVRQMMTDLGPPDGENAHVLHGRLPREYKQHGPSDLDRPAKTVLSGPNGPGGGKNCVRLDDGTMRFFTIRELCRVQGFPDTFVPSPVWTQAMKQLGNAAPPLLIAAWARGLLPARRAVSRSAARAAPPAATADA